MGAAWGCRDRGDCSFIDYSIATELCTVIVRIRETTAVNFAESLFVCLGWFLVQLSDGAAVDEVLEDMVGA